MTRGIKHQNKDIIFKILSENYKNKSLNVYGLDLPPIKEVLPTNLPVIELNEKRSDNLFLLEDDTILLLEYESSASPKDLIKYGHYCFRVTKSYYDKHCKIKIVVIYTADVETAPNPIEKYWANIKNWLRLHMHAFDNFWDALTHAFGYR